MGTQVIVILASLAAFAILGFFFYREISKLEKKKISKKRAGQNICPK